MKETNNGHGRSISETDYGTLKEAKWATGNK